MKPSENRLSYVLGIDLGAESIGWQLLQTNGAEPAAISACGVHTFDAGVDQSDGSIEAGKDKSRAAARRKARLPRRQLWRRARRRRKIFRLLQSAGFLPPTPDLSASSLDNALKELDKALREAHPCEPGDESAAHLLPYRLRAIALDRGLKPFELGRAIYHLAQRRGYKSNRREARKSDEDAGAVETGIEELRQAMQAASARTLGEYFSRLDPAIERVRRRWTARDMFEDEFRRIIDAQRPHHAALTDDFCEALHAAMFFQRPLKSASHLIGECELMPGTKRAPLALRIAQRFRLLQKVNDLLIETADGSSRPLRPDEREKLLSALHSEGDRTFAQARKLLKLPRDAKFNLERGDEKKIVGNRTDAKLVEIFGDRWERLSEDERDAVVDDVRSFEDEGALERRGRSHWKLDDEAARKLSRCRLEDDYSRHCREALRRLVAKMESGMSYMTARRELFPDTDKPLKPVDLLPPVLHTVIGKKLRNPAICRALTELRKLVNAIIRRYGKPEWVRLELARDLRNPRKKREEMYKRMRQREKEREAAKQRILAEAGIQQPRRDDVEKALLWDECRGVCPYTGRSISFRDLFGRNPQFQVEHIVPLSLCLDNSFANKTLCYHEENVRKHKRTPYQAYSGNPEQWNEILGRVKRFQGDFARAKLERFQTTDDELEKLMEGFTARQLQDTRYASRLAAEYLGLLYGGAIDADGVRRIQVSAGGVTAFLRNELGLNAILGLQGEKNRQDHRHHAVDALCIALASPAVVKQLADAAEAADRTGRRLFAPIRQPWPGFLDEARAKVLAIKVSRRANHRLRGALHQDTNYSPAHPTKDERGRVVEYRHVREPVTDLSPGKLQDVVDPRVRARILEKLESVGGDAKKLDGNWPTLPTRDGREIPIRRVRIRKVVTVQAIGSDAHPRYVAPGANHHAVIVEREDEKGRTVWQDHVVTRLDAALRKAAGNPVIERNWGPGARFVMWLAPGDAVSMKSDNGIDDLYYIRAISDGNYELRLHTDARRSTDVKKAGKAGGRINLRSADAFRQRDVRKVCVSALGEVLPCND